MSSDDPFARPPKTPSVSWKGAAVGTTLTIRVDKPAEKVTYGTWPDGNDKDNAVVTGTVVKYTHDPTIEGETRSVWAVIPSSLQKAIGDAQNQAGQRLSPGGTLHIRITGETQTGKGNPRREFAAKYEPPAAQPDDPWAGDEPPF